MAVTVIGKAIRYFNIPAECPSIFRQLCLKIITVFVNPSLQDYPLKCIDVLLCIIYLIRELLIF